MSTEPLIEHGTISSYTNHKCRCSECRATWAAYVKTYRKANNNRLRPHIRARSRAQTRLVQMFPNEFKALLDEEIIKEQPKVINITSFDPDDIGEHDVS